MIGRRGVAFGLTAALAVSCAPKSGPDEIKPTSPEVTASAEPSPNPTLPPGVEGKECPNLPGSYYHSFSATPVDWLCATAAGIKGLIDAKEKLTVEEDDLLLPVEPLGACVLNSIVHVDGETTYYAFARQSRRSEDVKGAVVTVVSPTAVIGGTPTYEVVFSPAQDGVGYEAVLPSNPAPVPVASLGSC